MKEQKRVEIIKQNIYAGNGGIYMDKGNAEMPPQGQKPAENPGGKSPQELEKEATERRIMQRAKKAEERAKRKQERKKRDEKSKKSDKETEKLSEEELRKEWYKVFTEEDLTSQDTRSTIEIAITMGLSPQTVTSKGIIEQKAEDVVKNALLKNTEKGTEDRLEKAETVLKQLAQQQAKEKAGEEAKKYEPLSEDQKDAIIAAHEVKGKGVFEYTQKEITEKARILRKAHFTPEQTRTLIEVGIAGEIISPDPSITGPLETQLDILNNSLRALPNEDVVSREEAMNKAIDRITSMPGVNEVQRNSLLNKISEKQAELQQQGSEARRQRGQGRQREESHEFVRREGDLDINVSEFSAESETARIAGEVKEAVERGQADNNFLKDNIEKLYEIQQGLDAREATSPRGEAAGIAEALKQTLELRGMLQAAKNLINGRESEENMRSGASNTLYGEKRLTTEEKEGLIDLILKGYEREVDEHFNKLFYMADTRSGDDWREAQGTVGQLEVDDFTRALTQYASGRMTFRGRFLTKKQTDMLDKVGRRLSQEVKLRQNLHDITYYVNKNFGIEDIAKVVRTFSIEDANMAYGIKGVAEVGHFFEQAMFEVMLRHGGYLPSEAMMNKNNGDPGEVEQLVRKQIQEATKLGSLDWNWEKDHWEIDRAVSVARGMGIVTGRMLEIVAISGIPPESHGGALVSWWANNIIKKIAFFRQVARYDIGQESNRFMAYKLEDTSRFWHTKELSEISALNAPEILNKWVNESSQDRWIDVLNPGQVGSLFYQTGWRYGEDKVNHAGAVVHLLGDNPFNPIIGAGMWVERERRNLKSTEKISPSERLALRNQFGVDLGENATRGQRAELLISRNLDLAAKITPLKLFHNMIGLKQQVLRKYYSRSISEPEGEDGRITITSEILRDDLDTLAVIQEKIIKKRADLYKKFLEEKKDNPGLKPPDLYNVETDLDEEINRLVRENKIDADKGKRVLDFAGHIRNEFSTVPAGGLSQKDKLINNLRDKGWKIPFVFGTDDLPYDLYNFTATGSNSLERRWGDINSVAQAASLFETLIRDIPDIPDQDTLIGKMKEVYKAMAGHDEGRAREFMVRFAEGIIKFYKKDIIKRLPAGFGMFDGLINGEASYAQIAYGRKQMAWDELDVRRFVYEVQFHGLIKKGDLEELRKKTGAENWIMGLAIARSAIPLGLLGFLYYMFTAEMEGLVKA